MMNPDLPLGLTGIRRGSEVKAIPLTDFGIGDVMRKEAESPEGRLKVANERLVDLEGEIARLHREHAAQLAQAREEAYQQGLKDGTAGGEASGRAIAQATMDARLQETEASLNHRLQSIECALEALFLDWEGRILELAMAISRRIVGEACEEPGVVSAHAARQALKKLGSEARIRLRVHPADFTALEREKGMWNARGNRTIELEADETIERGGVLVETEAGSIDARIPRMTAKVEEALAEALAEERARLGG